MARPQSVGIRELKEHTSEILRKVRTRHAEVEITYRGHVVARLVPVNRSGGVSRNFEEVWTDLDSLAQEIGANWPRGVSALEAVREGRREL